MAEAKEYNREDLVRTIRNFCDAHLLLLEYPILLDTIDEALYENAYLLVQHCIKDDK